MKSKSHTPATRLWGIVAATARTVVVFRRGPSRRTLMLVWDLASDVVHQGQWLAGRLYESKCGLSPDGRLLVYFVGKFNTTISTFTAVSKPPYFTALRLWPDGDTWGGGGFFEDARSLVLNYGHVPKALAENDAPPRSFSIRSLTDYRARHPIAGPETSQGWTVTHIGSDGPSTAELRVVFSPPWIFAKHNRVHPRLRLERHWVGMFERNGPSSVYTHRVVEAPRATKRRAAPEVVLDLGRADWADWDHDGSLLIGDDGRLWRQRISSPLGALVDQARPKAQHARVEIADLRGLTFSNVRAPDEARRWPHGGSEDGAAANDTTKFPAQH